MRRALLSLLPLLPLLPLFAVGCATHLVHLPAEPPRGYLIRDVSVFTAVPGQPMQEHVDVLIEGDQIRQISGARLDVPGVTVVDGAGRTLLPGLVDAHTHVTAGMLIPWKMGLLPDLDFNLEAALYSGVTTVVDLSGKSPADMGAIARRIESGRLLGPRLFHAGLGFTATNAHPLPYLRFIKDNISVFAYPFIPDIAVELRGPQDLDKVDRHLDAHPDLTKVYLDRTPPSTGLMSDDLLRQIVARSHARGVPVVAHIGTGANLRSLVEAGADGAVHIDYKDRLDPELARAMAAKNLFVIPTLVLWHNYYLFTARQSRDHYTRLEYETMEPARREALAHPGKVVRRPEWDEADKEIADHIDDLYANLRVLKDAGVTILAGSDAPNLAITLGGSLHGELAHLVKGGFTPTEALLAATSVPARVLGERLHFAPRFGTVEVGKIADLLLVRGDPTRDIAATQNIEAVFRRGVRLERAPGGTMRP